MNRKTKQDILKEIRYLEADIDNIDGDILDLEVEKEGKEKEIDKLGFELRSVKRLK